LPSVDPAGADRLAQEADLAKDVGEVLAFGVGDPEQRPPDAASS